MDDDDEDDPCEVTGQVMAITDAEQALSQRHHNSTGEMKALHQGFRHKLADID